MTKYPKIPENGPDFYGAGYQLDPEHIKKLEKFKAQKRLKNTKIMSKYRSKKKKELAKNPEKAPPIQAKSEKLPCGLKTIFN